MCGISNISFAPRSNSSGCFNDCASLRCRLGFVPPDSASFSGAGPSTATPGGHTGNGHLFMKSVLPLVSASGDGQRWWLCLENPILGFLLGFCWVLIDLHMDLLGFLHWPLLQGIFIMVIISILNERVPILSYQCIAPYDLVLWVSRGMSIRFCTKYFVHSSWSYPGSSLMCICTLLPFCQLVDCFTSQTLRNYYN